MVLLNDSSLVFMVTWQKKTKQTVPSDEGRSEKPIPFSYELGHLFLHLFTLELFLQQNLESSDATVALGILPVSLGDKHSKCTRNALRKKNQWDQNYIKMQQRSISTGFAPRQIDISACSSMHSVDRRCWLFPVGMHRLQFSDQSPISKKLDLPILILTNADFLFVLFFVWKRCKMWR